MKRLNFFKLLPIVVVFVLLFANNGFCLTQTTTGKYTSLVVTFPDRINKGIYFRVQQNFKNINKQYTVNVSSTPQYKDSFGAWKSFTTSKFYLLVGFGYSFEQMFKFSSLFIGNYVTFRWKVVESISGVSSQSNTYYSSEQRIIFNK